MRVYMRVCVRVCVCVFAFVFVSDCLCFCVCSGSMSSPGRKSTDCCYGVPTISRLLKMVDMFCKRALSKKLYSAKETYNLKEPSNCSHPICHQRWLETLNHCMTYTFAEYCLFYRALLQKRLII